METMFERKKRKENNHRNSNKKIEGACDEQCF